VVYFRVVDPVKALVNVRDYGQAVLQVAQTSLRSVIGRVAAAADGGGRGRGEERIA
jgi:hypothetical protein